MNYRLMIPLISTAIVILWGFVIVIAIYEKSTNDEMTIAAYIKNHDCIAIDQETVRCEQSPQEFIYIKRSQSKNENSPRIR